MFVPTAFVEADLSKLHCFIAGHSFGMIVSQVDGLPFATHIPFLLRSEEGRYGTLVGHFARANLQWREVAGQTVLVVFAGPHAYISPSWYEAPDVVPTWNFTAVHVYGQAEIIDGGDALMDILKDTVTTYEAGMTQPWTFDGTGTFAERLAAQVVGFRIPIERIEGKYKLNQNHTEQRRRKVIRALEARGDENSLGVAELMKATLSVTTPDGQ